jgi:hypothetical protein
MILNLSKVKMSILTILLLNSFYLVAQIDPGRFPTPNPIISSSPNATSLGTYDENLVCLYPEIPGLIECDFLACKMIYVL